MAAGRKQPAKGKKARAAITGGVASQATRPVTYGEFTFHLDKVEHNTKRPYTLAEFGISIEEQRRSPHGRESYRFKLEHGSRAVTIHLDQEELAGPKLVQLVITRARGRFVVATSRPRINEVLRQALYTLLRDERPRAHSVVSETTGFVETERGWDYVDANGGLRGFVSEYVGPADARDYLPQFPRTSKRPLASTLRRFLEGPKFVVDESLRRLVVMLTLVPILDRRIGRGRGTVVQLAGPTGLGKTPTLNSIARAWTPEIVLQNATSTTAGLTVLASSLRDQPVFVDDYKHGLSTPMAALIQNAADGTRRVSANSDLSRGRDLQVHGTLLVTGEDVVSSGHASIAARVVAIDARKGAIDVDPPIDPEWEAAAQQLLAAFAKHCAKVISDIDRNSRDLLKTEIAMTRAMLDDAAHARVAENAGRLLVAYRWFARFACTIARTLDEDTLVDECREALRSALHASAQHAHDEDVAQAFLYALAESIASGAVVVGGVGATSNGSGRAGNRVGWREGDIVFVMSKPAITEMRFPHSPHSIGKRLAEKGLLVAQDKTQTAVQRTPPWGAPKVRVWAIRADALGLDTVADKAAPDAKDEVSHVLADTSATNVGTSGGKIRMRDMRANKARS